MNLTTQKLSSVKNTKDRVSAINWKSVMSASFFIFCLNWIHVVVLPFRKLRLVFLKFPPISTDLGASHPLPNSVQCTSPPNNSLPPYMSCAMCTSVQSSNKCTLDMMVARDGIMGQRNNGGPSNVEMQRCVMQCMRMTMTEMASHHKNKKSRCTRKFHATTFWAVTFGANTSWPKMIFEHKFLCKICPLSVGWS